VIAADRFRKAVEELIDNAFKFSRLGSPIRIQTRTTDRHCVIRVSDRGRGMTAEQIASIGAHMQFERRFYEQQGAGLGLIIARRLAELHGGDLAIDSIPGEQTVVQLSLPKAGMGQWGSMPPATAG
jgi:two-component system, sensor histidine kinase and response regulator